MSSIISTTNNAVIAMINIGDMDNDCFISGVEADSGETVTAAEARIGLIVFTHDVVRKTKQASAQTLSSF